MSSASIVNEVPEIPEDVLYIVFTHCFRTYRHPLQPARQWARLRSVNHTWKIAADRVIHLFELWTWLFSHCEKEYIDTTRFLLQHPSVEPGCDYNLAIRSCVIRGLDNTLSILLDDKRADPTSCGLEMDEAARLGHIRIVQSLLKDRRCIGPQCLVAAAGAGHASIVSMLLRDKRFSQHDEALRTACELGDPRIVNLILQDGVADPDFTHAKTFSPRKGERPKGYTPLMYAVTSGSTEVMNILMRDPRVHLSGHELLLASELGHCNVARLLLKDTRIDPTFLNSLALVVAAKKNHADVVKLLLEDGRADPSANASECVSVASDSNMTSSHVKTVSRNMRRKK
ncbi:ankyrin-2 [Planoprotostelium fungivorum]|uniref:Ankyrin-2 n=1 Tax=Planoprotostelium fungivorum TaxID=1890364 RepID=A0A2P6NDU0_9EUKA|nr:ankyrin-2 [Planoprotostelium fungivorum]